MKQSKLCKTKDNSYNEAVELYQKMKYRVSSYDIYCKYLSTYERHNLTETIKYNEYNKNCKDFQAIKYYYSQKYKMPNEYYLILKTT